MRKIISIPYGAIKRHKGFFRHKFFIVISIPYGAIKSPIIPYCKVGNTEFQFLMVRLKVANLKYIQIRHNLFQFLMVRLKVARKK